MEILVSLALGVGLAAAAGFRVFVPFTFLSIAALAGMVELSPAWHWVATYPALIAFGLATVLEITAYYVPWLDNLLDTVAVPAAVIAGAVITASIATDLSPLLTWGLAIIVGGGAAGAVQLGTTFLRSVSSTASLGTGNFIVATAEWIAATVMSLLALLVPFVGALAVLVLLLVIGRRLWLRRSTRHAATVRA